MAEKRPQKARGISRLASFVALIVLIAAPLWLSVRGEREAETTVAAGGERYLFGTLLSQSNQAAQEYAAGVRLAEMELDWGRYEPGDGVFDPKYAATTKRALREFQAAGIRVILCVCLQYPPEWMYDYPLSGYVNQYGTNAPGAVDLTFNQTLREKTERYIARVHEDLNLNNFWAVRIGSGLNGEVLYPKESAGGDTNAYWAFGANPQGTGGDLPPTIAPNPYPGWRPGQTTYNGRPFAPAQVERWVGWYVGALADGVNWQIATYTRLGFRGYKHVLLPGWGSRPSEYDAAVAHHLDGTGDDLRTLGRGAAWHKVIEGLSDKRNVTIDITSVADGSSVAAAKTGDDLCRPTDTAVALTDPAINRWSSTRWITYNARRHGLPTIGENPSSADANGIEYGPALLERAVGLMRACEMQGLLWAHAFNLHNGANGVSLDAYAAVIKRYSKGRRGTKTAQGRPSGRTLRPQRWERTRLRRSISRPPRRRIPPT